MEHRTAENYINAIGVPLGLFIIFCLLRYLYADTKALSKEAAKWLDEHEKKISE